VVFVTWYNGASDCQQRQNGRRPPAGTMGGASPGATYCCGIG
jgi:hypothetical protein